jgi:hypothetical protein
VYIILDTPVIGVKEHSAKYGIGLTFKDYFISKPVNLSKKEPEPNKYTVCKMNKGDKTHFVIADFWWNDREPCWEFKSVGTRYLEYYSEGLNDWLLKCMNALECDIYAEQNKEEHDWSDKL